MITPERRGELYIVLAAFLWSLFPVVTILTFTGVTPIYSAAISTLVSSLLFAFILTMKRQWALVYERKAWKGILLISFWSGIIFYGFTFTGLRYTTAGNAAIMSLMEVFFSFVILGLCLRHEKLVFRNAIGGMCMLIGASFILWPEASVWHVGDVFILLAAMIAPLGNMYTQKTRKIVSAEFIMFCRSVISGCFLLLIAYAFEPMPTSHTLWQSLGFLSINGIVSLGLSKILVIESMHLMSITKAVSLESITPLFTMAIAYVVLHEQMSVLQLAGLIPIVIGVFLLTNKKG